MSLAHVKLSVCSGMRSVLQLQSFDALKLLQDLANLRSLLVSASVASQSRVHVLIIAGWALAAGVFVYGYCFYYWFARSDMSGFMQTSELSPASLARCIADCINARIPPCTETQWSRSLQGCDAELLLTPLKRLPAQHAI